MPLHQARAGTETNFKIKCVTAAMPSSLCGRPCSLTRKRPARRRHPCHAMAGGGRARDRVTWPKPVDGISRSLLLRRGRTARTDRLEQCRKEAKWRVKNGFHMFTAINTRESYEVLKDLVDRPVLSMNAFSGPKTRRDVRAQQGLRARVLLDGSTHYPLWHRALAGLYNTRCGFLGAAPWSYQDSPTTVSGTRTTGFKPSRTPTNSSDHSVAGLGRVSRRRGRRALLASSRPRDRHAEGGTKNPIRPLALPNHWPKRMMSARRGSSRSTSILAYLLGLRPMCSTRLAARWRKRRWNSIALNGTKTTPRPKETNSMKLVYFHKAFPKLSVDELIEFAHRLGFEGYDLCCREGYCVSPGNADSELSKAATRMKAADLPFQW